MWKNEQPETNVPDIIANDPELLDISWHNDAAASFVRMADADVPDMQAPRLWIAEENRDLREFPDMARFCVATGDGETIFESETDAAGAVAALKTGMASIDRLEGIR